MDEKYKVDLKCKNCGNKEPIEIPKGVTIEEHGKKENLLCNRCGCSIIKE